MEIMNEYNGFYTDNYVSNRYNFGFLWLGRLNPLDPWTDEDYAVCLGAVDHLFFKDGDGTGGSSGTYGYGDFEGDGLSVWFRSDLRCPAQACRDLRYV